MTLANKPQEPFDENITAKNQRSKRLRLPLRDHTNNLTIHSIRFAISTWSVEVPVFCIQEYFKTHIFKKGVFLN